MKNTSNAKALANLVEFFEKFNNVFENEVIDNIVNKEFTREYALLPLLVKAQLYYNEN